MERNYQLAVVYWVRLEAGSNTIAYTNKDTTGGGGPPGGAERGVPGLDLLKGGGGAAKEGAFAELLALGVGGSD